MVLLGLSLRDSAKALSFPHIVKRKHIGIENAVLTKF